ncbi:MAG TPA: patatin-like phospholipase family protein, partial [Saprospiraceae bacterium]|nr:patatin-like phospholipase family protein [Saprospiraceae bacterium]
MTLFRRFYYAFPIRLLALHFRNHLVLVAIWASLTLLVTGLVGRFFGMHYLMLTPEYLGRVDFWSFFLTGAAFGAFFMIWNLTTYLLAANRFPFLATLDAPFTMFCLNNGVIPLAFLIIYLGATTWFQWHDELTRTADIVSNIIGFLCGMLALVGVLAAYLYFTNKDIGSFLRPRKFIPRLGGRIMAPGHRLPTLWEIQQGATRWRVDTYLTGHLHLRLVRSVAHYHPDMLAQVFRQNHWNAVMVQAVALVVLMLQGAFMESAWVRVPTAAAVFVLASMVMSLFGAVSFWFRSWSLSVFMGLVVAANLVTGEGLFNYRNRAYGLDYENTPRAPYSYATFEQMASPRNVSRDKAITLQILNQWLAKNRSPEQPKPKMVFLCASGGGLRSALWTLQNLQRTDSLCGGKLLRQTVLMTGASGGMLGLACAREVMWHRLQGRQVDEHAPVYIERLGQDLLNPITFGMVANDLFYPLAKFQSGNFLYRKDRGYLFEDQLNENLSGLLDHRLADYRQPERDALIPMMLLSPFVLNDGRRMLISPQPVSYLMRPPGRGTLRSQMEIDGVDFGQLFSAHQADSLAFTTALRINCTFPFILPNCWLPTDPAVETVDAGFRDNYGMGMAVRFVQNFEDWIERNTSGVVFVQFRSWEKIEPKVQSSDHKGAVNGLLTPADAAANMTVIQDYEHDQLLSLLQDALGGPDRVQVVRFVYRPVQKQREASLSLHLS